MSSDDVTAETARVDLDKPDLVSRPLTDTEQTSRGWTVDDEAKQHMMSISFQSVTTGRTLPSFVS